MGVAGENLATVLGRIDDQGMVAVRPVRGTLVESVALHGDVLSLRTAAQIGIEQNLPFT